MSVAHITTRDHGGHPWSGQLLGTTWMSRGYTELALPLIGWSALESWPYLSPATALGKAGPAPFLGSVVKLVLEMKEQVTWPQGRGCGRAGPALSGMGWCGCKGDARPSTPCHF